MVWPGLFAVPAFVDRAVQAGPPAIHFHVRFINVPRAESGRITPALPQSLYCLRCIALNPAINCDVLDVHTTFGHHRLQLTVTDAELAVPANCPQDNIALKMPAFKWGHILFPQLNGRISLPPAGALQQCHNAFVEVTRAKH
jgi:hypothetical protein